MSKKKLYWNSCSFLHADRMISKNYILSKNSPLSNLFYPSDETNDNASYIASAMGSSNESIFRRTLIDCSKNNFDFVIIGWSHPERSLNLNNDVDIDHSVLKIESEKKYLGDEVNKNLYGYYDKIPSDSKDDYSLLKFEPKGTDDTILYTISLHNFFKQKNIPHLFLNMGKLDSDILSARESWIYNIDPKNYLSLNNNDSILEKMKFCFTEHYAKKAKRIIVKDSDIQRYKSLKGNSDIEYEKTGWIMDIGGHLGKLAYDDLFHLMYNHISKNNLLY
jgi:hypothetical protein